MLPALLFALAAHLHYTFTAFQLDPREVLFSPDSQIVATTSVDGFAALPRAIAGHRDDVAVAISSDGQWLASASLDKTVKLWRLTR